MQLHVDFTVPDTDELERHRARAEELGATMLFDRTDDPDEPLYVVTDPAGTPSASSARLSTANIRPDPSGIEQFDLIRCIESCAPTPVRTRYFPVSS